LVPEGLPAVSGRCCANTNPGTTRVKTIKRSDRYAGILFTKEPRHFLQISGHARASFTCNITDAQWVGKVVLIAFRRLRTGHSADFQLEISYLFEESISIWKLAMTITNQQCIRCKIFDLQ
jgi:hypothetical protein